MVQVTGRCHCGQVRYEAEVDPLKAGLCNCADCQMLTGSAFRITVPAAAAQFRLLSGRLMTYVKTADSGTRRRHSFCPVCGTPVHATADADNPPSYSLRVGCLEQRHQLPPQKRIWCGSALAWAQDVSAVPGSSAQ